MHVILRRISLFCLLVAATLCRAQAPTWTNLAHGLNAPLNELDSVAFGNGIFVAIKSAMTAGTLHYATSTDGTTWTARTIDTSIASSGGANRVRFLDGRFLIMPVGLSASSTGLALALTSTDGLSWTSATVGTTTTSPDEMDFGGGRALAVGSNNYFIGSTDFSSWSAQSTSLAGAFGIQDVAYGNGRWFITTNGGGEVATSTDGVTFTKVSGLSALGGFRVEYGNGVWFFYSQQNNAVSSDGVNFTTVTRTPNVTPGGTGTIRFLNGRFVAFGPTTFQASTDGQTWTDFGAPPSLGTGYVYTAIYDFAYGNGKYVAVGGRDFPSTSALIWVTDGITANPPGNSATFTLAFQLGATALPGTAEPVTREFRGYALHNGGVVIASANATDTGTTVVQHQSGTLSTLLAGTAGMPGGGDIFMAEMASDGTVAYFLPRSVPVNFAHRGALMKLENGTFSTLIADSDSVIASGTSSSSSFVSPSANNGALAFLGRGGNENTYVFRRTGTETTVIAEAGVTPQPNGTGNGKFRAFGKVIMGGDGRVFFEGYNEGNFTNPDFRRGVYISDGGALTVILDNTTNLPGSTTKFSFQGDEPTFVASPDGSKVLIAAGNSDYSTDTSARHGIYLYAHGTLSLVADDSTSANGDQLTSVGYGSFTVMDDGTIFFYASAGSGTHLYRAKNGVIERFQSGDSTSATRSPEKLWLHNGYVYFTAYNASIQNALFRKAVDGSFAAQEVLNVRTHPDFVAIDTREIENLLFAGDQVLLHVGAVTGGIQRSALFLAPLSAIEEPGSGGNNGEDDGGGNPSTGTMPGHIINVSIRGDTGPGDKAIIVGTVVSGTPAKSVLVRAVGPTLSTLGVAAPLPDPHLRLVVQGTGSTIDTNDDWAGDAQLSAASSRLGAFALASDNSKDAALYVSALAAGPYSIVVTGNNNGTGPTLAEVYDAEDDATRGTDSSRLVNISGRGHVGAGDKLLVAGFVVAGATPVRVLVRGVGPTLAGFGVTDTLADPQLQLFRSDTGAAIATNDNWESSNATELAALASTLGAFDLPNGSKDAALLMTLQPGVYTVHLTGVGGSTGVGLIEVYEVPN